MFAVVGDHLQKGHVVLGGAEKPASSRVAFGWGDEGFFFFFVDIRQFVSSVFVDGGEAIERIARHLKEGTAG